MHDKQFEQRFNLYEKFTNSEEFKKMNEENIRKRLEEIDLDGVNGYKDLVAEIRKAAYEQVATPFRKALVEMDELYMRKNTDYGDSFAEELDEDGLIIAKFMLRIKLKRFTRLIKHDNQVKDESMRDTLIDLANYAVMTLVWLDNKAEDN